MKYLLPLLMVLVLAACENSGASYMIDDDKDHSISLLREQRFVWSDEVEQKLVVARFPTCQKRFPVTSGSTGKVELELYAVRPMLFVAHQGKEWWALGTERCEMQKFDAPPASPGELIGRFQLKDGELKFVAKK